MQPRIYTYKITFEEVPYYYYGSKKEKKFNEEYWGSPATNKWCWELYTPKKQILELFDFTDDGYEECRKVEDRLIKPVLNDPWCLNERYGGCYSLKIRSKSGKIGGRKTKELGLGIFSLSKEERIEIGKKSGERNKELGIGFFSLSEEELNELRKKGRETVKELQLGFYSFTKEMRVEYGKKSSEKQRKEKSGIFSLSKEEKIEMGRKGGTKTKELGVGIFGRSKEQHSYDSKKNMYNLTKEQRTRRRL